MTATPLSEVPPDPAVPPPPTPPAPPPGAPGSTQEEGRFLSYVGHAIPWQVRLVWILFWSFSAWYVIRWLLPALNSELLSPP